MNCEDCHDIFLQLMARFLAKMMLSKIPAQVGDQNQFEKSSDVP